MELVFVEIIPGDAVYFQINSLHRSESNLSDSGCWSLISVYNRGENILFYEPSQSSTIPLKAIPDEALTECETGNIGDAAHFLKKKKMRH